MLHQNFYKQYIQLFKKRYSSVSCSNQQLEDSVSPFVIPISKKIVQDIQQTIDCLFQWSRQSSIHSTSSERIKNQSVLMAYDFHIDSNHCVKLIEINTNASGFLVVDLINQVHGIKTKALEELKKSFLNEWNQFSQKQKSLKSISIIDEDIQNQKMKFEFFMYQHWMRSWEINAEVSEASLLTLSSDNQHLLNHKKENVDLVYNRLTDFYLNQYPHLKYAYENQIACFSPNSKEYEKLADKKNLCSLYSQLKKNNLPINLSILKRTLPKTIWMNSNLWEDRKNLFFKPAQGYGSKASYRGKSITKKKFSELTKNNIAQEYIPPPQWIDNQTKTKWKFDIRAYAYQNQLQLIGGRIYQGQVTNFQVPFSGFCSVRF